jgi:O-antigen/teichoic acid export membrane protein
MRVKLGTPSKNGENVAQVRLRYSGLVALASKIFSVFTGVIFTLTVTRRLSPSDFGIWALMGYVASYFTWPSSIANFWATRYTARNTINAPRTAITTNLAMSATAALFYLPFAIFIAYQTGADRRPFILFTLFIALSYVESTLESISNAKKPQIIGFAFFFFEMTKVVCALVLVAALRLGLLGTVLSLLLALVMQALTLLLRLWDIVHQGQFEWSLASRWIRHGWLAIYSSLPSVLGGLDRLIAVVLAGASIAVAYLGVAAAFSATIGFGTSLAIALYPRLLSGGDERDVETVLKMALMFIVPASFGIIWLSEPLLALFRPDYVAARIPLYLSVLGAFIGVIENIVNLSLMGIEKVDVTEKVTFRDFRKSALFILPTFNLGSLLFYLPMIAILSIIFRGDQLQLATAWSLLSLIAGTVVFGAKLVYSRKRIRFRLPIQDLSRYLTSSLIMILVISAVWRGGDYSDPILLLISRIAPTIIAGAVSYFVVLYLIDPGLRRIADETVKYLRFRK